MNAKFPFMAILLYLGGVIILPNGAFGQIGTNGVSQSSSNTRTGTQRLSLRLPAVQQPTVTSTRTAGELAAHIAACQAFVATRTRIRAQNAASNPSLGAAGGIRPD